MILTCDLVLKLQSTFSNYSQIEKLEINTCVRNSLNLNFCIFYSQVLSPISAAYITFRLKQHTLYHMFRFICGNKSFSLLAKKLGTNACILSLESVSHFLTSCNVPTPVPTINVFKPQFLPKRMSVSALKKNILQ